MKNLIYLMLCITFCLTAVSCKKEENIGPNYYGSRTANLTGMKFGVERYLGGITTPFEEVTLLNGSTYFNSEEPVLNDKTVRYILSNEFVWNNTWNAFLLEAEPELQDSRYGKRYWWIGTIYYGWSGIRGPGIALVQIEKNGSLANLATIHPKTK